MVIDTASLKSMEDAVLDYHVELKGSAFVVVGNALVNDECACKMSFSLAKPKRKLSNA